MAATWCKSQTPLTLVAVRNGRRTEKIAFDSRPLDRWEIYVADATEGIPRKLVTNTSGVIRPHWSRDGKWIYFSSHDPGRMGVYRCPASGGDAVALSKDIDGFSPQESFDGKTLYFASREEKSTLKKVALPGAVRSGIRSGRIASCEQLQPLDPHPGRYDPSRRISRPRVGRVEP
jgi:dipeptidyl aminopeptidase/acylaminoacyl peptidase